MATCIKESIFSMLIDIFSVDKILIGRNNVPFMRTNKTFMLDKDLINGSLNILTKVRFKTLIKFLFIGIEKRLTAPIIYSVYNYLILSKKKIYPPFHTGFWYFGGAMTSSYKINSNFEAFVSKLYHNEL